MSQLFRGGLETTVSGNFNSMRQEFNPFQENRALATPGSRSFMPEYSRASEEIKMTRNDLQDNFFKMHNPVHSKKSYSVTTDEARHRFIRIWNSGTKTIKEASEECGINYSTAKSIVKLLKIEGRIEKKKKRTSRKSKNIFQQLERAIRSDHIKRLKINFKPHCERGEAASENVNHFHTKSSPSGQHFGGLLDQMNFSLYQQGRPYSNECESCRSISSSDGSSPVSCQEIMKCSDTSDQASLLCNQGQENISLGSQKSLIQLPLPNSFAGAKPCIMKGEGLSSFAARSNVLAQLPQPLTKNAVKSDHITQGKNICLDLFDLFMKRDFAEQQPACRQPKEILISGDASKEKRFSESISFIRKVFGDQIMEDDMSNLTMPAINYSVQSAGLESQNTSVTNGGLQPTNSYVATKANSIQDAQNISSRDVARNHLFDKVVAQAIEEPRINSHLAGVVRKTLPYQ